MTDNPRDRGRVVFLPFWHDNPYQELLAWSLAALGSAVDFATRRLFIIPEVFRGGRPSVVHIHAPDHYIVYARYRLTALARFVCFFVQLVVLRLTGVTIVWTAHDLTNQDGRYPELDALCRQFTARLSDAVVVHCNEAKRLVVSRFDVRPPDKVVVIPHGGYSERFGAPLIDRQAARVALQLPDDLTVLLFLGNLRPHKGLPGLVRAFRELDLPNTELVIRGEPYVQEIADEISALVDRALNVDFQPGFVDNVDVVNYMRAADAIVCPFTSSLAPASVAVAMTFGRACIAPRLGCIPVMLGKGGGILYDPDDPQDLANALRTAVTQKGLLDEMGRRNLEAISRQAWPDTARAMMALYQKL